MSDEKELELKIVQKRVKRLWMLAIISFVAVVLMTVSYIVYGYLPQKMQDQNVMKMLECANNGMSIKLLGNGQYECDTCEKKY